MTTVYERNYPRLREVLVYLSANGPTNYRTLLDHVAERYPPVDDDMEMVRDDLPFWVNNLLWSTTGLVKARWLTKDGRGGWAITDEGRQAVERFTDPVALHDEVSRLYAEWDNTRREQQRRAWLIRGSSVLGANLIPEWLAGGWISLPASQLRSIEPTISADDLAAAASADYDHLNHQEQKAKVDEILAFVTRVRVGDVVTTTSDGKFYVGDVTGDVEYQRSEEGRSNLRRTVDWRNPDSPLDFSELPDPLPAKLRSGSAVIDLTAQLDLVEDLTLAPPDSGDGGMVGDERPVHEHLPEPKQTLADELLLDLTWLQRVRDLLNERKQIVLYGPPGTGKTFLAQKLAEELVGDEQVRLVQFHPAYSYEDFFEGYRPEAGEGGTIGFRLRSGPLRRLANEAAEHRDLGYVLIIDEINRADLAKVFGELYFLLEYRKKGVQLMYSPDESFSLPDNLYIIGTMNTADRSIALVDSAMRRRFGFVGLEMDSEPTRGLLRRWSQKHQLPALGADLLAELNRRIDDPEFQIGPSYFMKRADAEVFSIDRLERIWESDILPLLQEHFYGRWEAEAGRFALKTLLRAVGATGPEDPEAQGADSEGDGQANDLPLPAVESDDG